MRNFRAFSHFTRTNTVGIKDTKTSATGPVAVAVQRVIVPAPHKIDHTHNRQDNEQKRECGKNGVHNARSFWRAFQKRRNSHHTHALVQTGITRTQTYFEENARPCFFSERTVSSAKQCKNSENYECGDANHISQEYHPVYNSFVRTTRINGVTV